jgi:ATP-dependent Lhr-like helicase
MTPATPTPRFHPAVAAWFAASFASATAAQAQAWPAIQDGRDVLIAAPTGSGKTLAAFLAAIDALVREALAGGLRDTTQVVYVSPLKALSNDIQRNLERPLAGIRATLQAQGLPEVEIRTLVRSGDTPAAERTRMFRRPPHIVVTTPESLYILLGSESGRRMLATTRTVIVDEIHALAPNKRGAHLALSLERLAALAGRPLQRIGLSATQKPIAAVARFLVGAAPDGTPAARCTIVDTGHRRARDLALEVPAAPLEAVMSNEVWEEVYDRLAELVGAHRTTLVFVNTRRLAERVTRHLSERLGATRVAAHHGSLAKELRLAAERRLKAGELAALVATASLELGIDIGEVELVCQLGSPRSIASLLQRVGRSGHGIDGTPKGRLFPLSRDELVECAALLDSVRRGELDRIAVPKQPLDVLAQQIVAEIAAREWGEQALYALVRRAWPYRALAREDFVAIVRMLAEGYSTRRGRHGALVHHDAVNRLLRGRRGARLTALTSGGTIPDNADYQVVLAPDNHQIGTVNEDFAVESLAGDVFQLGNNSYRILRIERGTVRVEDAHGLAPNIPFWLGEAPGRSDELSQAVSRLRAEVAARLEVAQIGVARSGDDTNLTATRHRDVETGSEPDRRSNASVIDATTASKVRVSSEVGAGDPGPRTDGSARTAAPLAGPHGDTLVEAVGPPDAGVGEAALRWLVDEVGLIAPAARQLVDYLAAAHAALGCLPTQDTIVLERFFDEAGGMQLVVHSPYGSRLNRAWGLALRKRFCRKFNFELQAAATEDNIVLSLTTAHSFALDEVPRYLQAASARALLVQALLDAPMFITRWRWCAGIALALPRFRGGRKVPPQFQRIDAEDLVAAIFPDQLACAENLAGEREIPDHPLVAQTLADCLGDAMDADGFCRVLAGIEAGTIRVVTRDLTEPSPLALEVLSARPYAFLDDAPLEERRTQAVMARRWLDPESAAELGRLDPEAIARVREEAWPDAANADELHDALVWLAFLTEAEAAQRADWGAWLAELGGARRVARLAAGGARLWIAAERVAHFRALYPHAHLEPAVGAPAGHDDPSSASRGTGAAIAADTCLTAAEGLSDAGQAGTAMAADATGAPDDGADRALVEILRGRLEGLGPVTTATLLAPLALPESGQARARAALAHLEAEGFALRGRYTPDAQADEWCERRLLARIHRYTVKRLRAEIEPVGARDLLRFLFAWQHVAPDAHLAGPDAVAPVVAQLEGFEAPAGAWETEILPARIAAYEPAWLDDQCQAGRITWARLAPRTVDGARAGRSGPLRTTPITLLVRRHARLWSRLAGTPTDARPLSSRAQALVACLRTHGASFFDELVEGSGLLRTQVEEALGELVAAGLASADSFAGLRALLVPSERRKPLAGGRRRHRTALFGIEEAGRWALARTFRADRATAPSTAASAAATAGTATGGVANADGEAVEHVVRTLLRRYGVVFRRLLDREAAWLPPWRDLLRCLRRLEARGEIRGGRFVAGFSGEQFALPEAIGLLREARRSATHGTWVSLSAADPLNLVGLVTPGGRIAALTGNRVLYRDGLPIAVLAAGEVRFLTALEPGEQWAAKNALLRRAVPPQLAHFS